MPMTKKNLEILQKIYEEFQNPESSGDSLDQAISQLRFLLIDELNQYGEQFNEKKRGVLHEMVL